ILPLFPSRLRRPPRPTLFPYTTLFRSRTCRGRLHTRVDSTGGGGSDLGKGRGLRRPKPARAACARRTPPRLPLLRRSTFVQHACASSGIRVRHGSIESSQRA